MQKLRKRWWIVLVVLAVAAGGYWAYQKFAVSKTTSAATGSTLQTARVRRGDLIISATGSGTVVARSEVSLAFEVAGTVTDVNVAKGDKVSEGDVLANVDDIDAREAVAAAELQLVKAQIDLASERTSYAEFEAGASDADLQEARASVQAAEKALADVKASATQADLLAAEAAVESAQETYDDLLAGPSSTDLEQAEMNLSQAKNSLWSAQMSRDAKGTQRDKDSGSYDAAQVSVWNAEFSVRNAEIALEELKAAPTEAELAEAKSKLATAKQTLADLRAGADSADLASAEAAVAKARETLANLEAPATEDETTVAEGQLKQAELTLEQAQLNLESAQSSLEATALTSPLDATVMEVDIEVGERVSEDVGVITVADLAKPLIELYVDESDMAMLQEGYSVEVTFDAIPDTVFEGTVTQVDPDIQYVNGSNVLHALVELNADSYNRGDVLMPGMGATVDVIGGEATNAILVPLEALRDLGDGQYGVFVMENGEPVLHVVTVGLQDVTYAEITSGLQGNETVTTGIVETN